MKLLICYNKYSGHNKISLDKIIKDLSNTFDVDYFIPDINLNIKDYIINNSSKYDILLIVGGDGTIHDTINTLKVLDKLPTLAFIPNGTCNDISNSFGYNSYKKSIEIIKKQYIYNKPLYMVNDIYFMYGLAIGGVSNVSYETKTKIKRKIGKLAYYIHTLKDINNSNKYIKLKIKYDDIEIIDDYYLLLILKSRYLAGVKINKKFNNDLNIFLEKKRKLKIISFIKFLQFVLFNKKFKLYLIIKNKNIIIESEEDLLINTDGELGLIEKNIEIKKANKEVKIIADEKIINKYFN